MQQQKTQHNHKPNKNKFQKTHNESHTSQVSERLYQRAQNNDNRQGCGEKENSCTELVVGIQTCTAIEANTTEVPQKTKNRTTYDLAITCLGGYLKESEDANLKRCTHPALTAVMFTVAKTWSGLGVLPQTNETENTWRIHSGVLQPQKKRNVAIAATTWMNLEGLMLSEICQRKTSAIYLLPA